MLIFQAQKGVVRIAAKNSTSYSNWARKKDRHHLLYPRRAWTKIGPNARSVRRIFSIKINRKLHSDLHKEVNKHICGIITREMLPDKDTIRHIKKSYQRNRKLVRAMGPIEKLEWLIRRMKPSIERNEWTIKILTLQLEFLRAHAEEL